MIRVGVISDTHGLLRPEALAFLAGSHHIVHGGDIGNAEILAQLSAIAPVTAVRGNNDRGAWAEALAETELVELGGARIYAIHDLALLAVEPAAAGIQVLISGHSHKPVVAHRDGVVYVNPGSAGPRRFRLPVAVAELVISGGSVAARIVELEVAGAV
ncbi:MAG TPA: metallophosphoesterase family protein [Burkholderiaceae bacterium]|nr:metallophosphoesterase family protein [Burkholderiaceae bacterium]